MLLTATNRSEARTSDGNTGKHSWFFGRCFTQQVLGHQTEPGSLCQFLKPHQSQTGAFLHWLFCVAHFASTHHPHGPGGSVHHRPSAENPPNTPVQASISVPLNCPAGWNQFCWGDVNTEPDWVQLGPTHPDWARLSPTEPYRTWQIKTTMGEAK